MRVHIIYHKFVFFFAIISGLEGLCSCQITCKSPSNENVDWFIVYKVPESAEKDGSEYFYMDSTSSEFSESEWGIQSETDNPVLNTLLPLYSKSNTVNSYGMYNDQPPPTGNAARNYGHSKGVFAFGKENGFWFVSSVPHFPAAVPEKKKKETKNAYEFNDSQTKLGQVIFCVTLKSEHMETLDLYRDLIRGDLGDLLYVQSWHPNMRSDKWVTDVKNVCFENGLTYNTSSDHSKWAVAKQKPWTCFGDINRTDKQFKRGGLALCLYDVDVASEFRNLVLEKDRCAPKKGIRHQEM